MVIKSPGLDSLKFHAHALNHINVSQEKPLLTNHSLRFVPVAGRWRINAHQHLYQGTGNGGDFPPDWINSFP